MRWIDTFPCNFPPASSLSSRLYWAFSLSLTCRVYSSGNMFYIPYKPLCSHTKP